MLNDKRLLQKHAYINGQWTTAKNQQTFPVYNPADNSLITEVADLGAAETTGAIEAAAKALPSWQATTAKHRAEILHRWFELLMENTDDLARLMTAEQGKPLAEAKGEVTYGASFIQWFGEEAKRTYGDIIPTHNADRRLMVLKQPIGVVAAITPWNFPIAMITRKAAAALAAGCTMVIKPAPDTPLCALALAELGERAGIPAGVLNIIPGLDAAFIGKELCDNPVVKKLSFTGSTAVGKLLMQQCAQNVKKIPLELGGNAPFIIFDDADLEAAVTGTIACKFRNAGQTCVSVNRLLVQDKIYDQFAEKLARQLKVLKVGPGIQESINIGPLINKAAVNKVERLVEDAVKSGAKILEGGKQHHLGGQYYQASLLINVSSNMDIAKEEIFGPVACMYRFANEQEAIEIANNTSSGLAAYFYTQNIARVWRVSEALDYGMIGVNEGIISTESAPFGGVKESGIGREGSKYGIDEYLEMKYVCVGNLI